MKQDDQKDLHGDNRGSHQIRSPHVKAVSAHGDEVAHARPLHGVAPMNCLAHSELRSRSRMIERTRMRTAAIEYIQKARAKISMPVSMVAAMLGLLVRLTDAP